MPGRFSRAYQWILCKVFRRVFWIHEHGFKRFFLCLLGVRARFLLLFTWVLGLAFFLFDSTVLGEHDLQKHIVN